MQLNLRNGAFNFFLLAMLIIGSSCRPPKATKTFSRAFEGGYDPEGALRQQGYALQTGPGRNGVRNPEAGYGWQSWQGILTAPKARSGCETAAAIVRDSLNSALNGNCLDELTRQSTRSPGQPLTGLLRYNKDGMHGDVHVWLIPNASETTISYVIFVREERMK